MNVLGFEIDIEFIYNISPVMCETSREDAYWFFFELWFKDGRSHKVEIKNNFVLVQYGKGNLVLSKRELNNKQQRALENQKPKDLQKIELLREKIIKAKRFK